MRRQQTIDHEVALEGRGLFTGAPVRMTLRPGQANTGIWFIRTDCQPPARVRASIENVSKRARRTAVKNGLASIETVEHLLSACSGMGVDNLEVELNAGEVPGVDGSSRPFVEKLREAGLVEQEAAVEPFVIPEVLRVHEGDSELIALPPIGSHLDGLEVSYELDYGDQSPIGRQHYTVRVTRDAFEANIAPARTFVLEAEAQQLKESGLGAHLGYQDVLVFGADGPVENELRFPDECVRHKILDLIGDLYLFGRPIIGRILARKSGHSLNHELVRALEARRASQVQRSLSAKPSQIDIRQILRVLPHRYPFLLIDRVVEIEGSKRVVGLKNVTINEEFFQGHYPGDPIMPGVLILESLAQLGGVLLSQDLAHKGTVAVLISMDKVKFRRPVRPGDQLMLDVTAIRVRSRTGHIRGVARVLGELAAEAEIKFHLTDADSI